MINQINIKSPGLRHSDLKIISNKINIKKTQFFYKNISRNNRLFRKEFETKRYSKFFHDKTLFKNLYSNFYKRRSEVLLSLISKKFSRECKILDFGCNRGELLLNLKKHNFKNLYGYDINNYFRKSLLKNNIYFTNSLKNLKSLKFDLIIFSHSLQYVDDIFAIKRLIKKITKKNAKIILVINDISKRPLSFSFSDQNYFFDKLMLKNLFLEIGSVKFLKSDYFFNDILALIKIKKGNKVNKKLIKIKKDNIGIFKKKINKLKTINQNCNVYHYNFQSKIAKILLKDRFKSIVVKKKIKIKSKSIIEIKQHLNSKLPLIVFGKKENENLILKLKNKKIIII
tara:strand:- start:1940 stop:2962 length:1023 start_codon:yes stop_codon:yes gene_type:complete